MADQKNAIVLDDKATSLAHYPHARRVGHLLFLCGTSSRRKDNSHVGVVVDDDGNVTLDIEAQTEAVIENMRDILQSTGADLDALVDVTTFLVDMKDFKGYNKVYNRYFEKETGPARTTVAVHQLPHPNLLVEIKAIAHLPKA
ncbi:MAG: RidA family protein [Deltaproteobacteria bacterium]|nr:RidA family protein [Deltaproteobacteria bacterium]